MIQRKEIEGLIARLHCWIESLVDWYLGNCMAVLRLECAEVCRDLVEGVEWCVPCAWWWLGDVLRLWRRYRFRDGVEARI